MKNLFRVALVLLSCSVVWAAEKQLKPGESEAYNGVLKDLGSMDFAKSIADLDAWQQKYPDSDFKDERAAFFVQAYAGGNQAAKALDAAGELLAKDLNTVFPGPTGQAVIIRLLYNAAWAVSHVANPTPAELNTGDKAAHQLLVYDQPLPGVSADKWAEARVDMKGKAETALLYIAMLPGIQAMAKQPADCAAAEAAYTKAVMIYPDKAALAYELGRALNCEAKIMPEKLVAAVYGFLRAAAIDPTLGNPATDPKKIQAFADSAYVRLHGSEEGLAQLKQQVKQSPLPPPNFTILTAAEVAAAKAAEFEKDNPQLALWMKIRAALLENDGGQYFESQLKDSSVPRLAGVLVEAKPACRPKELLVSIPLPDAKGSSPAEITLKLDKPRAGKPELNAQLSWEGVPSAFVKEPFMLTMDTESGKIQGLTTTACAAPPARRSPKKL